MSSVKIKAVYCLMHACPLFRIFPLKNEEGGKHQLTAIRSFSSLET